ncbi:uncharacterized protein si:dkeyp-100a1.6 [Poeciliopsis prolifica]|uniref:uncharacterized protein si:dkeyp-100a1.6 n=1 Tax=Poeciliopsis prolifica TaxID=188132 RepID=UPI0024130AE0|nr:uncharacterized protein si:dkeyp-100a1.6 [Poeciliopsis prolifica]
MLPESSSSLEDSLTLKMFAIIEQWDEASDQYTDVTKKHFMLLLVKFGLETAVFYSCSPKKYTYFLSVCSLFVLLADFFLALIMGVAWLLGPEKSSVSTCFLLATASKTYGALPLPMLILGFVDYCLHDVFMSNVSALWKTFRNVILSLVVWAVAIYNSVHSDYAGLVEQDSSGEIKVLLCKVTESTVITTFVFGLFVACLLTLVPFWFRIPQWVREVDRMLEAWEYQQKMKSDLLLTSTWNPNPETKTRPEEYPEEISLTRPPLWFSITLGFILFWMPYLVMSVSCLICGVGVPTYLGVNLLWLECSNSLLVGLVFWAKSYTKGPCSSLPENVCLWQIYWQLSKDIQQSLPLTTVFKPQCEKKSSSFHV